MRKTQQIDIKCDMQQSSIVVIILMRELQKYAKRSTVAKRRYCGAASVSLVVKPMQEELHMDLLQSSFIYSFVYFLEDIQH